MTIEYPDIETKAKAQEYLGMDMEKMNREKEEFMETVVPKWLEAAKEREENYSVSMN